MLDANISTPTRKAPRVLLEEIDGDSVVVRVQATPERASDGARLADEIIAVLVSVTGEHRCRRTRRATRLTPGRVRSRVKWRNSVTARSSGRFPAWRADTRRATSAPPARRCPNADTPGATDAMLAPIRSPSGATLTSARLRSIALMTALGHLLGRAGPDAGRQLHARVGEHPGVADEAGRITDTPDAGAAQIRRGRRARSRAARTWWRCTSTTAGEAALPDSEEMNTMCPRPRCDHRRSQGAGERDRRAQVDLEHRVDLRLAQIEQMTRRPAARRWRSGCRRRRPRRPAARRRRARPGRRRSPAHRARPPAA